MANIFSKLKDFMKIEDYDGDDAFDDVEETESEDFFDRKKRDAREVKDNKEVKEPINLKNYAPQQRTSKVVNFNTSVQMEVHVVQPQSYEEAQEICNHIIAKKPVVINLEKLERHTAQRVMDFVSGACYSLNGNLQRITHSIFIIAPENIDINGDFQKGLAETGVMSWDK